MMLDVFLHRLRQQLKGFSPEDQAALIEEISSHIESGEQDYHQGEDEEARRLKIMSELGSPDEMGQSFKEVHRPNRWRDFLLVLVPIYFLVPLATVLFAMFTNHWQDHMAVFQQINIRLIILMGLLLALFGVRRHSALLLAFWVPHILTYLISMMTREQRWLIGQKVVPINLSLLESIFWYVVLFGLVFWVSKFVWKNRNDWLIVLFTLQPFIITIFNVNTNLLSALFYITPRLFYWTIYGVGGIATLIAMLSLAGIFLLQKRSLRWLSFLVGVLAITIQSSYAYWPNPPIIAMWLCLPALLGLVAWYDWRAHRLVISPTTAPTTQAN